MTGSSAAPPRVVIVTPAPRGSRSGNRKTALRWAGLLRQLGARPLVVERWQGQPCDLLVAVHIAKSADSVSAAAERSPGTRIAVVLAGTDIYPEYRPDRATLRTLSLADALIALQPASLEVLPPEFRGKTRTIVQSATALAPPPPRAPRFTACVLAHLRPVKDPLLPFAAMALVDPGIDLELICAGRALVPELATAARAATERDARCRWLGEIPRQQARALLATSHLCVVPSAAEGGANVVSEAIAAGTPLLASAIPGNTGLLGTDWPGLFPVGDAGRLATLLTRTATDAGFYDELVRRVRGLQDLVSPARERAALRALLRDLGLHLPGAF